ncbi:hypothetical protein [Campylobacter corcagiensis]|uniref:Uncharacterized protein n=1 Tax=Campylobacter corcagiensis TaxID=1448857 RepID=A0A6M8MLC1_9BACT|nr:hypothetical protein [Campylobacter corcagiensis]QKF65549.1 hypothetical protein CCORG_a0013 [Campylobacter corcagiensis]QOQ86543.1 hypothetical protein IMC76_00170 [Campylobacter corcagiensis]
MEINQSHFLNETEKSKTKTENKNKSKKNNTSLIVLFILVFVFVGMIYFIFNLPKDENLTENVANNTNKQDTKQVKQENNLTISNNTAMYIPPMPITEDKNTTEDNTTTKDTNIFDLQAIEKKKNEPVIEKKEVVTTQEQVLNEKKANNERVKNNENNLTNENFEILKKEAKIKTNFFNFRDKNFYEGDTIMDFKILEVTNFKITLQNKNNELKEIYK